MVQLRLKRDENTLCSIRVTGSGQTDVKRPKEKYDMKGCHRAILLAGLIVAVLQGAAICSGNVNETKINEFKGH